MQKANETVVNVNDITRISKGTSIKGDIISVTDIRVDGKIDGTVFSEGRIVVGDKAELSGALYCTNLDMWGKMVGDIYAKDTLSIKNSANIEGHINVRRIQVEMGAQLNVSCHMITEQEFDKASAAINKKVPVAIPEVAAKKA